MVATRNCDWNVQKKYFGMRLASHFHLDSISHSPTFPSSAMRSAKAAVLSSRLTVNAQGASATAAGETLALLLASELLKRNLALGFKRAQN
jgi:hypothetical protein